MGRQSFYRHPALPGTHRHADDVQQHRLEGQQQLALRDARAGASSNAGMSSATSAPRLATPINWRRERTIQSRSSASPFILGVDERWVDFAYDGWYRNLVRDRITPADVAWASNLLGRLSERQWHDAFRAAGYDPAVAERFIRALGAKIQQGRSIASRRAAVDDD